MRTKRAQLSMLEGLITSLVVVGFLVIIGLSLIGKAKDAQIDTTRAACGTNATGGSNGTILYSNCSFAYNGSIKTLQAMDDIPDWLGTVVLAVIAVAILGVVYLIRRYKQ